ncbi:MAG: AAA family ATPase [Spirulinaceae cyanobacterium RM2_2_10]|nr:AAA family ATPase [Spirulinaceae cyanobacterium RM2_2_10]
MIPLQLSLKNFLSYRQAQLDFRELHAACVCGANGAGKSSLLEAIAWALWGEGRTSVDETIYAGADEARVDFMFTCDRQTYRVSRARRRNKDSQLEFQIQLESGRFRSLTAKIMKETQSRINQTLHLDYDTFINSAYLRQGHADEFMLQGAAKRKEVLGKLL